MINNAILLCFGGIAIASVFMLFSFSRMVRLEGEAAGWSDLRHNRSFVLALCLVIGATGLTGISAIRTIDGLRGAALGGSSPVGLFISLGMLWTAWTGFHWAATLGRSRWHWRLYLLMVVLWTTLMVWPYLPI